MKLFTATRVGSAGLALSEGWAFAADRLHFLRDGNPVSSRKINTRIRELDGVVRNGIFQRHHSRLVRGTQTVSQGVFLLALVVEGSIRFAEKFHDPRCLRDVETIPASPHGINIAIMILPEGITFEFVSSGESFVFRHDTEKGCLETLESVSKIQEDIPSEKPVGFFSRIFKRRRKAA